MKDLNYITKQELILEEIFLSWDKNEESPNNVYADNTDHSVMYAVCFETGKAISFKLVGNQDEISIKHRDEILQYRIGDRYLDKDEFVTLGDIFMHGKFIKRISI